MWHIPHFLREAMADAAGRCSGLELAAEVRVIHTAQAHTPWVLLTASEAGVRWLWCGGLISQHRDCKPVLTFTLIIIPRTVMERMLCIRYLVKCSACIITFNLLNNSMGSVLLLSLCYRWETEPWGSEVTNKWRSKWRSQGLKTGSLVTKCLSCNIHKERDYWTDPRGLTEWKGDERQAGQEPGQI